VGRALDRCEAAVARILSYYFFLVKRNNNHSCALKLYWVFIEAKNKVRFAKPLTEKKS